MANRQDYQQRKNRYGGGEGQPAQAVPAGRFQAQSWSPRATEADFRADVAALELLKRNRVTDVYVQAGRGAFTDVPAANIQRLFDYLDANGRRYVSAGGKGK